MPWPWALSTNWSGGGWACPRTSPWYVSTTCRNADRCFPDLTVAVQPAYEMGSTAAQRLLSRLEERASTPPCLVVLPAQMILRRGAASTPPQEIVIEPLTAAEQRTLSSLY